MAQNSTALIADRFIAAFRQRDPSAILDLVGDDCTMESMQPAPDGQRVTGYDANVRFWQAMIANRDVSFEIEDLVTCGERAIIRVRYSFGRGRGSTVRGVILLTVRDERIVEALAYAKTDLPRP